MNTDVSSVLFLGWFIGNPGRVPSVTWLAGTDPLVVRLSASLFRGFQCRSPARTFEVLEYSGWKTPGSEEQ